MRCVLTHTERSHPDVHPRTCILSLMPGRSHPIVHTRTCTLSRMPDRSHPIVHTRTCILSRMPGRSHPIVHTRTCILSRMPDRSHPIGRAPDRSHPIVDAQVHALRTGHAESAFFSTDYTALRAFARRLECGGLTDYEAPIKLTLDEFASDRRLASPYVASPRLARRPRSPSLILTLIHSLTHTPVTPSFTGTSPSTSSSSPMAIRPRATGAASRHATTQPRLAPCPRSPPRAQLTHSARTRLCSWVLTVPYTAGVRSSHACARALVWVAGTQAHAARGRAGVAARTPPPSLPRCL
jgi:hypothetical protein